MLEYFPQAYTASQLLSFSAFSVATAVEDIIMLLKYKHKQMYMYCCINKCTCTALTNVHVLH